MRIAKIIAISFLALFSIVTFATTHVHGYFKKSGTYVAPHYKSSSNQSRSDNWSSKGNINPYTGKKGYKNPSRSYH